MAPRPAASSPASSPTRWGRPGSGAWWWGSRGGSIRPSRPPWPPGPSAPATCMPRPRAELVAGRLGIPSQVVEITPMVDAYFTAFPDADPMRRGNKMARERMTILFDHSARLKALVLGTSNKTELMLGYGTLYGDMASAVNPLGDLWKTQVRALARHVGLPEAIVQKQPSADLWVGQTDEGELGFTYERVDQVLHLLVDRRYEIAEV